MIHNVQHIVVSYQLTCELLILKTIRINRPFLNQFLNELTLQKIITSQDIRAFRLLETSAENLIALIKKEYHLK